jgi:hypothetical protein
MPSLTYRWLCLLTVAASSFAFGACADPPGLPTPTASSYAAQTKALITYNKYAPVLTAASGVMNVYLTTTDPREIVVMVPDVPTANQVGNAYGHTIEGLPIDYRVVAKDNPDDRDPSSEVAKIGALGSGS